MTLPVRNMNAEGVGEAVDRAESEGWQPGLGDAGAFFAADPEGFFCSVEGDRTVGTISVVRGSERVAFVGLYIVDPGYRGRGHGKALWDEALSRREGFTLGLDAVPAQVETYASDGFVPAYGNARYTADAESLPAPDPAAEIKAASAMPFDELVAFDGASHFGPRPGFLKRWIGEPGRRALVTVREGSISGFAVIRPTTTGHRIGPVFTRSPEIARDLILGLADGVSGPVSIDLPRPNQEGVNLLLSMGMTRSFETTRMYRGRAPELPLDRIFGITSLELG